MKHYEDNFENFIEEYKSYLKCISENDLDTFLKKYPNYLNEENIPYHDPDSKNPTNNKFVDYVFYNDLCTFLNSNGNYCFELNEKNFKVNDLSLYSDQFGFSAPKIIKDLKTKKYKRSACYNKPPYDYYPYAKYIEFSDDKDNAYQDVANWIYTTRTIGGSFIWPRHNSHNNYNLYRGANKYIEDSVDLTLLEIKHFYEVLNTSDRTLEDILNKYKKYENDILFENLDANMITWLLMFKDFDEYAKFFKFEGNFVRNGEIVDIFKSDIKKDEYKFLDDNKNYSSDSHHRIQSMKKDDIKDLKRMLDNVCLLIEKRSENIEKKQ